MGLNAALAVLQTAITARVSGVTFFTGARHVDNNAPPPRIVWIPLREKYTHGPTRGRGSGYVPAPTAPEARAVGVRAVTVGAHVWTDTFDATEALLDAVLKSAHATARGSFDADSIEWETDSHSQRGEAVTCELTLNVPVLDEAPTVAQLTAVSPDTTGAIAGDNIIENGDP